MKDLYNDREETFEQLLHRLFDLRERKIVKCYDDPRNINYSICSECGGECCKRCGCHFSPDDFSEISFEYLKSELEKGYISLDYVEGDMIFQRHGIYILRIRNKGADVVDLGYERTPCILLTEEGCRLSYDKRPTGGRLLMPSESFADFFGVNMRACQSSYTIEDCCHEWKPYQNILEQLVKHFQDKDIPCSI